jgi:hypothetical protein
MWYVVYTLSDGEAFSYGTVLAEDMPEGFGVLALSEPESVMILEGTGLWNPSTLQVEPREVV